MEQLEQVVQMLQEQVQTTSEVAETVQKSAEQARIIAINAAIEAAHAAAGIKSIKESVMNAMMTSTCRTLVRLLDAGQISLDPGELQAFATWIGVDDIFITDADGVTIGSNLPSAIGWRFPEDPKAQAFPFRALLKKQDGVVCQPIDRRSIDGQPYKYVGASRVKQPGIVQVGFRAESVARYQSEVGTVFGVLAEQVKDLSVNVEEAAKRMRKAAQHGENNLKAIQA